MRNIKTIVAITALGILTSCSDFLNVVPDSVPTIENAFTLRTSAEKYLATCYHYMPANGLYNASSIPNTGFNMASEVWYPDPTHDINQDYLNIAKGQQNVASPYGNSWSGSRSGTPLFQALRDCNTFLENIGKVVELDVWEREKWIGEVTFLKAYYHFLLFQRYGPIPLVKVNMPISASPEQVKVYREPVDSVVNYIVSLLDSALVNPSLPERIVGTENSDLGRITKCIAIAFKAKVLVTAASPLFNGNPDYGNFVDNRGIHLFNPEYSVGKWQKASAACKEAIDYCTSYGYGLSTFAGNTSYILNDTIKTQLDIRTAITNKINNPEVIWPNTDSRANEIQRYAMTKLTTAATNTSGPKSIIGPTIRTAEMFYTNNGVPIEEDKIWGYENRYQLDTAEKIDKFYIKEGQVTVKMHFNREPRFYADLGFDRGIWWGNWVLNYSCATSAPLYYVSGRKGEISAKADISNFCITGYYAKKLVNIETSCEADGKITSTTVQYPWPELRMADLYLLYSEALNEASDVPVDSTFIWINLVRARAGLKTVQESWTNFSKDPLKFTTKTGFREILQHERAIELVFEGQYYWDLCRWKTAHVVLNNPVKGWDIAQAAPQSFYTTVLLYNQTFEMRNYLWPIETRELQINSNLEQNPGW